MSKMEERVAKALAEKRYMSCGGAEAETLVPGTPNWRFCVDDAQIAIEAMNEPTNEMLDFGQKIYTETSDVRDAYVAMVHTAFSRDFPY